MKIKRIMQKLLKKLIFVLQYSMSFTKAIFSQLTINYTILQGDLMY